MIGKKISHYRITELLGNGLFGKDRNLRYQTASDLLRDLKRLKRGTDTLHPR